MVLFWHTCKEQLQQNLTTNDFDLWIEPLIHTGHKNTLTLHCQDTESLSWIRNNALTKIKTILYTLSKQNLKITVQLKCLPSSEKIPKKNAFVETKTNQDFTFQSFVQGPSNQEVIHRAKQLANSENQENLLLISGTSGLGKTHLLHAIANQYLKVNHNHKIICLHSESFVQNMVKSFQENTFSEFKSHYRSADLFLLDDIQFIAGKDRSQEELLLTLKSLLENSKRIVITSPSIPNKLTELGSGLSSLCYQGTIVELKQPEFETLMSITINKFRLANIEPGTQIILYFAKHFSSNIRELEGVIRRVISFSQFTNQKLTLDLVKEAVSNFVH